MGSDCNHEIKTHLLLGRKAVENLDSARKQRHHLANKGLYSQSWIYPVVINGHESCIIKKVEDWRTDAFKLWCWRRLLRVPWAARRSNKSILKDIDPEYSLEGLMLKLRLQYFCHLRWRTNSSVKTLILGKIEGKRRRGWQRMWCLDGLTDSVDMTLNNRDIVKDREAWYGAVYGVTKS